MFQEDFQMLGFVAITAMVGAVNFVTYVPILLHGWMTCGQITANQTGITNKVQKAVINFGLLKKVMAVAVTN